MAWWRYKGNPPSGYEHYSIRCANHSDGCLIVINFYGRGGDKPKEGHHYCYDCKTHGSPNERSHIGHNLFHSKSEQIDTSAYSQRFNVDEHISITAYPSRYLG